MSAIHWIRRMLHTVALAAAGLLSDVSESEVAAPGRRLETEDVARSTAGPAARIVAAQALHPPGATRELDTGRLESLVDRLGEAEPALAAVLVGTALCHARPLERMPIVCEWATSSSLVRRRALARALAHPFMCAGLPTAIETLAQDDDAHVRTAAAHAALLRLGHDPLRYGAVLDRFEHRSGQG